MSFLSTIFYYKTSAVVISYPAFKYLSHTNKNCGVWSKNEANAEKAKEHYFAVGTFVRFDSNYARVSARIVRWESLGGTHSRRMSTRGWERSPNA